MSDFKQDAKIATLIGDISKPFASETGGPVHLLGFALGFLAQVLMPSGPGDPIKSGKYLADVLTNSDKDKVEQGLHDYVVDRRNALRKNGEMSEKDANDKIIKELDEAKKRMDDYVAKNPKEAQEGLSTYGKVMQEAQVPKGVDKRIIQLDLK